MTASVDTALGAFADEVGAQGPVAVAGGRTRWDLGGTPAPGVRLVAAPAGIVDHVPEEMTVTVRAGTSVAELHTALAARGQRTALPERGGTVGGALAVGEHDLRALGRGLVRHAVLQLRYVSADGRLITAGGPTVKNVSGFDLPRLLVGSLGTLGLLGEAVLRTNPIPPVARWLAAEGADPRAVRRALHQPSAILWDGTATWVQLEGHGADVDAEQVTLGRLGRFTEVAGPPDLPGHRWSLSPSGALAVTEADAGPFVAAIGLGLVYASRPAPARSPDAAALAVAARLKQELDPTGRLNPGRTPGGR